MSDRVIFTGHRPYAAAARHAMSFDVTWAVCTVASKNYLAKIRVLADSIRRHHPGIPLFALIVDRIDGFFDPRAEPFSVVELEALEIPELSRFTFKYSIVELNTATKPFLMRHLFGAHGLERLIYLDPDVLVLGPLTAALERLEDASILLTPHRTAPRRVDTFPTDVDLCRFGAYNLGFLGLRATPSTQAFLEWWAERLYSECLEASAHGYFVDQKWMDLAPSYFEGVEVLRDPTYNVARWNLPERTLTRDGPRFLVDGAPCTFFHFSRVECERDGRGPPPAEDEAQVALFALYARSLEAMGHDTFVRWPYAFGFFDNGVAIPAGARRRYLELGDAARAFGDPFATAHADSYYRWLARFQRPPLEPISGSQGPLAPRDARSQIGLSLRLWGEVTRGLFASALAPRR